MVRVSVARQEADRLLFQGRWHPVTLEVAFFAAEVDEVAAAYYGGPSDTVFTSETVHGDLEQLLGRLLPLQAPHARRLLFVPVAGTGRYRTAVFTNSFAGTETGWISAAVATRAGIPSISVRSCPNDRNGLAWPSGAYGSHEFGMCWATPVEVNRRGFYGRTVGIRASDGRSWDFVDHGDTQPFEDTAAYTAPRVRDRFNQQTLIDYAAHFGVRPFDADFYAPDRTATFVRYRAPNFYDSRIMTLAEVQGPWQPDALGRPDPEAVTERPPPPPLMELPPGVTREILPDR